MEISLKQGAYNPRESYKIEQLYVYNSMNFYLNFQMLPIFRLKKSVIRQFISLYLTLAHCAPLSHNYLYFLLLTPRTLKHQPIFAH